MILIKGKESLVLGDLLDILYIILFSGFGDRVNRRVSNTSEPCSVECVWLTGPEVPQIHGNTAVFIPLVAEATAGKLGLLSEVRSPNEHRQTDKLLRF